MPRNDAILWIDLETTGSSDTAKIIEFGAIITDQSPQLKKLGEISLVIDPEVPIPESYEAQVVVDMHKAHGLTDDLLNKENPKVGEAEKLIIRWINDTIGFSTEHIPWGGSGVGHFDSKYIRRDMTHLAKRLTYWVYDVGVIRRTLRLAEIDQKLSDSTEIKTHRAVDDIHLHVQEMRDYLSYFRAVDSTARLNDY